MSFTQPYSLGSVGGPSRAMGRTPGRLSGAQAQGINYPSPFFDVAHTHLPPTVKQLFRYCRYYFLTNALVNATVCKLSEYPVTDVIFDHEKKETKDRWTTYFHEHLRYRAFMVEAGLDYFCYGNCFVSLTFQFQKWLTCTSCKWSGRADKHRAHWRFSNYDFRLTCPQCGETGEAVASDHYPRNASGIRLLRWNPEDIEIDYNDTTGESTYYYTVPPVLKSDIVIGKKNVVESTPQIFIEALRQSKGIVLSKANLFHLKRPTIAWQDRGWGIPLILPVLKDTFYLQVMKKAQEAILLEHIVPLRIVFPQAGSGTSDPFTTTNLVDWREQVAAEIARWRYDNNYIPIMPLPLGQQSIGGDGRALLLFNEMQALSEHIIMGMGVPREFLMGGLSYSGTNVSMRMLENAFLGYVSGHAAMAKWVVKMVAGFMRWPEANVRFKPFKMADDIQRKMLLFQYNQAGKVSDATLLSDMDLDQEEEDRIMASEAKRRLETTKDQQLGMAEIQGEVQEIMMKYQAKGQQAMMEAQAAPAAMGEPGAADAMSMTQSPLNAGQDMGANSPAAVQPQGDIVSMAKSYAQQLVSMQPQMQEQALSALMAQSPELANLVRQFLAQLTPPGRGMNDTSHGAAGMQIDMRPMSEKQPMRREMAMV